MLGSTKTKQIGNNTQFPSRIQNIQHNKMQFFSCPIIEFEVSEARERNDERKDMHTNV